MKFPFFFCQVQVVGVPVERRYSRKTGRVTSFVIKHIDFCEKGSFFKDAETGENYYIYSVNERKDGNITISVGGAGRC